MGNSCIMVVVGERQWTLQAIHLACAVARSTGSDEVVLLNMVPVRHTWLLGTDLGLVDFSIEDQLDLVEYSQIPAIYGVGVSTCVFQYDAYVTALLDAAEQLNTPIVFALPPRRLVPLWHEIEVRWLKRALSKRHRSLYTLEQPDDMVPWTPLITVASETAVALPTEQAEPAAADQLPAPSSHGCPE